MLFSVRLFRSNLEKYIAVLGPQVSPAITICEFEGRGGGSQIRLYRGQTQKLFQCCQNPYQQRSTFWLCKGQTGKKCSKFCWKYPSVLKILVNTMPIQNSLLYVACFIIMVMQWQIVVTWWTFWDHYQHNWSTFTCMTPVESKFLTYTFFLQ